jgi:hypothetical protein
MPGGPVACPGVAERGNAIMETQTLLNFGFGLALSVVGWLARELWGAVKELRRDLHEIEVDLPSNYVQKSEYGETMKRIEIMFERIFDKLDGKADKP